MHTQIEFTVNVVRLNLCDFSDSHLVVKGRITDTASFAVIFKISCIKEINKSSVHKTS